MKDGKVRNSTSSGGGFSRSVQPKSHKGKAGQAATGFQQMTAAPPKLTKKMKMVMDEACRPKVHLNSEAVIAAGPGSFSKKKAKLSDETRPTIPNVPQNSNIVQQVYQETDVKHLNVVNEIKTRSKVAAFATDFAHIQLL